MYRIIKTAAVAGSPWSARTCQGGRKEWETSGRFSNHSSHTISNSFLKVQNHSSPDLTCGQSWVRAHHSRRWFGSAGVGWAIAHSGLICWRLSGVMEYLLSLCQLQMTNSQQPLDAHWHWWYCWIKLGDVYRTCLELVMKLGTIWNTAQSPQRSGLCSLPFK